MECCEHSCCLYESCVQACPCVSLPARQWSHALCFTLLWASFIVCAISVSSAEVPWAVYDGVLTVNGCSTPSGTPFKKEFTPYCNRHDLCYTCASACFGDNRRGGRLDNADRRFCDRTLRNDLDRYCRNTYPNCAGNKCDSVTGYIGSIFSRIFSDKDCEKYCSCQFWGTDAYYAGVTLLGAPSFDKYSPSWCYTDRCVRSSFYCPCGQPPSYPPPNSTSVSSASTLARCPVPSSTIVNTYFPPPGGYTIRSHDACECACASEDSADWMEEEEEGEAGEVDGGRYDESDNSEGGVAAQEGKEDSPALVRDALSICTCNDSFDYLASVSRFSSQPCHPHTLSNLSKAIDYVLAFCPSSNISLFTNASSSSSSSSSSFEIMRLYLEAQEAAVLLSCQSNQSQCASAIIQSLSSWNDSTISANEKAARGVCVTCVSNEFDTMPSLRMMYTMLCSTDPTSNQSCLAILAQHANTLYNFTNATLAILTMPANQTIQSHNQSQIINAAQSEIMAKARSFSCCGVAYLSLLSARFPMLSTSKLSNISSEAKNLSALCAPPLRGNFSLVVPCNDTVKLLIDNGETHSASSSPSSSSHQPSPSSSPTNSHQEPIRVNDTELQAAFFADILSCLPTLHENVNLCPEQPTHALGNRAHQSSDNVGGIEKQSSSCDSANSDSGGRVGGSDSGSEVERQSMDARACGVLARACVEVQPMSKWSRETMLNISRCAAEGASEVLPGASIIVEWE